MHLQIVTLKRLCQMNKLTVRRAEENGKGAFEPRVQINSTPIKKRTWRRELKEPMRVVTISESFSNRVGNFVAFSRITVT